MKLRSVFLTAVFFSVGIAFAIAEEPADEDTFRETTYAFDNSSAAESANVYDLSFYHTANNRGDNTSRIERNGIAGNGSGRNDYSVDYKNDGIPPTSPEASAPAAAEDSLPRAENEAANDKTAAQTAFRALDEDESLQVYDLSISYYDSISEKIGFTARGDRKNPLVFFEVVAEMPNDSLLPNNETYSFLSFDKKIFTNTRNWTRIISGGTYTDNDEGDSFISVFSFLSIPFAILSISICIGFILIMFTSTGNKTNV